jgi:hypothetical protein
MVEKKLERLQAWLITGGILLGLILLGGIGLVVRDGLNTLQRVPRVSRGPEGGILIESLDGPVIITHITAEDVSGGERVVAALEKPLAHLQHGNVFLRTEQLQSLSWESRDTHKPAVLPANPRWGIVYSRPSWIIGTVPNP